MSTTLNQTLWNISQKEALILIDKYLDIIEDLEDYMAIKKHKDWKVSYLNKKEEIALFDSLLKDEK